MRVNFSGKSYRTIAYHMRDSDCLVDMAEVESLAKEHRPKLVIAGWRRTPGSWTWPPPVSSPAGCWRRARFRHCDAGSEKRQFVG
jgi:hypothetical protein